jgi:hypothetical protein
MGAPGGARRQRIGARTDRRLFFAKVPLMELRLLLAALLLLPAPVLAQAHPDFPGLAVEPGARRPAAAADDALPPPTAAERDAAVEILVTRLSTAGVSAPAAARAKRAIRELFAQGDGRAARGLANRDLWLFIIPKDKRLTDLPEFAALRGRRTHDGRPWEEVRGVGHMDIPGGRLGSAFPEEDLLNMEHDPAVGYPGLFVLVHELAHCVQDLALPSSQYARTLAIYNAAVARPEKTGLGRYADANAHENFAQAAAAYLGVGHLDSPREHADGARRRVLTHQPLMAALLGEVFGPARDIDSAVPNAPKAIEHAGLVALP